MIDSIKGETKKLPVIGVIPGILILGQVPLSKLNVCPLISSVCHIVFPCFIPRLLTIPGFLLNAGKDGNSSLHATDLDPVMLMQKRK